MYVCMYVCMYACLSVYVCIYVCVRAYIVSHTHTDNPDRWGVCPGQHTWTLDINTNIIMAFVTPVVGHWLEAEIAQWVHDEGSILWPITPWSGPLPWSCISLHNPVINDSHLQENALVCPAKQMEFMDLMCCHCSEYGWLHHC